MIRALILLVCSCTLALGQSRVVREAFLQEVNTLRSRQINGETVVPATRIEEELGFSTAAAEALIATAQEYYSEAELVERGAKRAIFERRMQVTAGETVSLPTETEIMAEYDRRLDALLDAKMQQLKAKLGETAFEDLGRFIDDAAPEGRFFRPRKGETTVTIVRN